MNTTTIQTMVRVFGPCILALLVGCGQKAPHEFITTSNGLIFRADKSSGEVTLVGGKPEVSDLVSTSNGLLYRINKQSGEVCLIVGSQMTKVGEPGEQKPDEAKKSHLRSWPDESLKRFGDPQLYFSVVTNDGPKLRMKTTWRNGKLFYIASVSQYSMKLQMEREKRLSQAAFNVNFTDENGFDMFALPLRLSEMSGIVDDTGRIVALSAKGSVECGLETYESIKLMTIGWSGFPQEL